MSQSTDLFGAPSGPAQFSLFGAADDRLKPPVQDFTPKPEKVRAHVRWLIAKARKADTMPWSEREVRMWQTVFPNMTSWLPDEEAAQLRLEFFGELERLKAA